MKYLHDLLQEVWYEPNPRPFALLVKAVLFPISCIYGYFAASRRSSARPRKLSAPVISIGNLTVGGTGKTTFVIEVNRLLTRAGVSGIILTRGYGRDSKEPIFILPDTSPLPGSGETGDEPLVLSQQCPQTPVLVGGNRLDNYYAYVETSKVPNFVLLDDGFQHHAIRKDVNICLIDGQLFLGNRSCLPSGPLREPLSLVPKPDVIILTRVNSSTSIAKVNELFEGVPTIKTNFVIEEFTPLDRNSPKIGKRSRAVLVSALGNNNQFRWAVEDREITVIEHYQFPDHHTYSRHNIDHIENWAREQGVSTIITTWKDAVKVKKMLEEREESIIKWYACDLAVAYEEKGKEVLTDILLKALPNNASSLTLNNSGERPDDRPH